MTAHLVNDPNEFGTRLGICFNWTGRCVSVALLCVDGSFIILTVGILRAFFYPDIRRTYNLLPLDPHNPHGRGESAKIS